MSQTRIRDEHGFSLVELLVVIFIVGILAAIALPNFMVQSAKGQDGVAKSNVRSALTYVEACYTPVGDYNECRNASQLGSDMGFQLGTNRGQVEIVVGGDDGTGFLIRAHSESGNQFDIRKPRAGSPVVRECDVPSGASGRGACPTNGRW